MTKFETFLKQIGAKVRIFRAHFGWTQVQASEKLGVPARRYQDIEAGRANLTLKSFFRLAQLFKISPRRLL